jgi:hypothetical protein
MDMGMKILIALGKASECSANFFRYSEDSMKLLYVL